MSFFVATADQVETLHNHSIRAQGGAAGLRDRSAFLSVWSRVEAAWMYSDPDPLRLGSLLAHGLMKAHPFVDGNKRSAWAALALTLAGNGWRCDLPPSEAARCLIEAAGSSSGADALEAALRPFCGPDPVFQMLFDFDRGLGDLAP